MSDLPDVQQYLKSVCNHYAQWWKDYAFMDEINASTWFEFELTSRTEDKPKSSEEKPPDKLPPQPVLQAIENYANEKILIVGSSGAGKSTLLARIFWQAAERARHDETAPIPVLVELKAYQLVGDRSGIRGLILNSLESHDPSSDSDDLKKLLKQKRLMLLVDGLNELQQAQAKNDLKKFCLNISLIATARHAGDGWEIERKLELQPLSQLQVRDFLEVRLPTSDRDRLQELSDRVQDFGQTPLMVWMLYCIFRTGNEIPETRGEVYRKFTNLYVERSKEGIDLDESRSLLSRLAFGMMQSPEPGDPTDFQLDISEVDAQNLLGSEKELKLLRDCHLLQSFGGSGNRRVRFCHQSLQEYYAAEYLLTQLPKLLEDQQGNDDLKSDYLNYRKWTEPVALMLALVESEAQAVRVVELSLEIDLMLGARLVGEVKPGFQANAMRKLANVASGKPSWLMLELLQRTGSKAAVNQLISLLDNPSRSIRDHAYLTLLTIDPEAIPEQCEPRENFKWIRQILAEASESIEAEELPPLHAQILENLTPNVWTIYDEWVSKVLTLDEAITTLAPMLQSPSSEVRWSVVQVIGSLNSEASLPTLLQALENSDESIRYGAGIILGRLGFRSIVPKLVQIVCQNANPSVRHSAVRALCIIGSKEVTPGILKAIQDSDVEVCREAVEASVKFDSEEIAAGLLEVILHPDLNVRRLAADNLRILSVKENIAKFLNETHLQTLIKGLENSDNRICWRIAFTLWNVASEEVIPLLQAKLNCTNANIRLSVALVLGKFGCQEAVPELIQMMDYSNLSECPDIHEISYTAAYALIQVQGDVVTKRLRSEQVQDDVVIKYLPKLLTLLPAPSGENVLFAISGIQAKCKFYNYEIYQAYLEAQTIDRPKSQNSDRSPTTTNHFPNATEVKIFENVDRYHEAPLPPKDPPS